MTQDERWDIRCHEVMPFVETKKRRPSKYYRKPPIKDDFFFCFSTWGNLGQVVPSWIKLVLVGYFCPLVGQEVTKGLTIVFVAGDPGTLSCL